MKLKSLVPDIITENSTQNYDYGCVMLYFTFRELSRIHDLILPTDIYTEDNDKSFGLEDTPHTTLLYGFHKEVPVEAIEHVTEIYTYYTCKAHNLSLFEAKDYDVLKYDIDGDNLKETNSDLKHLPHTSTFPDYHPHLTISYLKKGAGQKYVDLLNKLKFNKFWLAPQYIIYSHANGGKSKITIKTD